MIRKETDSATSRATLDALAAGVLVFGEDGIVELANMGAARILARPIVTLRGSKVEDLLAPVSRLARGSVASRLEARPDLKIRLPDGSTTDVGFTVTNYVDDRSGELMYVVLFQEIGGVLQLRKERDRLLQLAAGGDALPSALHELRNPLAAVTSFLELLLEEPDAAHAKELHAILSEIRRMTLTLQGIGGLIRSARAEKATAIDAAVRDACTVLDPMARRKGIFLRAVGEDMPLLKLDREVVSGVVFNLVKNAIDACSEGDVIEVDARLESDDVLALAVSDNGPGMTPDVRARCCELFYTSKEKGSGIGLALCKRVAEVSHGRLDIDTAPGRGTTITLRFPLGALDQETRHSFRTLTPTPFVK
jgi:signal transduction histidine kinase